MVETLGLDGEAKLVLDASWVNDHLNLTWDYHQVNPYDWIIVKFRAPNTRNLLGYGHPIVVGRVCQEAWSISASELGFDLIENPWEIVVILIHETIPDL